MLRRTEPTYPSFSLVINEALDDPFRLPPYQRYAGNYTSPPMMSVDYRYAGERESSSALPEVLLSDFWPPNEEASNLQAALENRRSTTGMTSRRRRLTDLVIDLAHIVKRKSTAILKKRPKKNSVKMPTPAEEVDSSA